MNIEKFYLLLFGALVGAIITASLMYYQIQNRYDIGVNSGFIAGGQRIITFLKLHVKNEEAAKNSIALGKHLDHKATRLSVVEIDGIKTIIVK